ncbi:hypothetical protein E4U42_003087 [Claviceps africana]|uniref:Uncharacterized protein n=1 Tax=Claviceps africana TaxID=83212 RepID=A0A8K0JCU6_9HYPO|nr:hypothetical protein E4U42_003087 [Claviceps africana]
MLAAIVFYAGQTVAAAVAVDVDRRDSKPPEYKTTLLLCKEDPENMRLDCGDGVKVWPTATGYTIWSGSLTTSFRIDCLDDKGNGQGLGVDLPPHQSKTFELTCPFVPKIKVWTKVQIN